MGIKMYYISKTSNVPKNSSSSPLAETEDFFFGNTVSIVIYKKRGNHLTLNLTASNMCMFKIIR